MTLSDSQSRTTLRGQRLTATRSPERGEEAGRGREAASEGGKGWEAGRGWEARRRRGKDIARG